MLTQRRAIERAFGSAIQRPVDVMRQDENSQQPRMDFAPVDRAAAAAIYSVQSTPVPPRYPVQHVIQRACDGGHPDHDAGPCIFDAVDNHRPRRGGGSFRSIYSTPQSADTEMALDEHQSQHLLGAGNLRKLDVLHAPNTPLPGAVRRRDPAQTGAAFLEGTGYDSARKHMEAHGYSSGPRLHHRTHVGGYGQHGPIADAPDNIVAAAAPVNGQMTTIDKRYPPGFISLNEAEVEPGTHIAHRINQGLAHRDAPRTPLFRIPYDAQQPVVTREQWDASSQWAQRNLNPENLEATHLLQNLSPGSWPTMDDIREQEDNERVAAALMAMRD